MKVFAGANFDIIVDSDINDKEYPYKLIICFDDNNDHHDTYSVDLNLKDMVDLQEVLAEAIKHNTSVKNTI